MKKSKEYTKYNFLAFSGFLLLYCTILNIYFCKSWQQHDEHYFLLLLYCAWMSYICAHILFPLLSSPIVFVVNAKSEFFFHFMYGWKKRKNVTNFWRSFSILFFSTCLLPITIILKVSFVMYTFYIIFCCSSEWFCDVAHDSLQRKTSGNTW